MDNSFDLRRVGSYVFIAGLAVLFALQWGPGARGCGSARTQRAPETVAATVNGKALPIRNFLVEYSNQMNQYRQSGAQLPPGAAKMLGIPTQVMDRLVSVELLSQAAEERGIAASDAELRDILVKNPGFQKDGKFDVETYRSLLRDQLRQTPQEFEADLRRRLSAQKMLEIVEAGALVADDEVKARYAKEADRANVTFVKFNSAAFAGQLKPVAPMELEAWVKANAPAIAANYEQNKMSYFQPERVKARQLVLLAAKDAGEAKIKEAREKAEGLRKELLAGKDFGELA
jgi:peptidyl-prolyl cis-trans isomerase D